MSSLVENGILARVKRGYYSFNAINDLFYYGKKLISMKEYDKATACFEKCHELDPFHPGVCFQLFLRCIQNRDYQGAFQYFDRIYDTDNQYYQADSNFYLYLLSMVTELPERYKLCAKSFQLEDIRVDFTDKRYTDIPSQNKVRMSSLSQRFTLAAKQLNYLIRQNDTISVQNFVIKTLLNQVIEKQKENNRMIIQLLSEKQYEKLINYLESLQENHNLSVVDQHTLFLTKDLVDMLRTGIIPKKQIFTANKIYDAIDGKNYELALSLSSEYINKFQLKSDENAIHLLLIEIKNIIERKNESLIVETQEVKSDVETLKEQSIAQQNMGPSLLPSDIIRYLQENDLKNVFLSLGNYLDSIGKKQYEFLIIDLIKISLIEGDTNFTKPVNAFTYVAKENFQVCVSEYLQNFYEVLSKGRFDEARIYSDIISKSLEQMLISTEKNFNFQENNGILEMSEHFIQNDQTVSMSGATKISYEPVVPEKVFDQSVTNQAPTQKLKKEASTSIKNVDYDDTEFIYQKLDDLSERGIILLRPMNQERRREIHDIVQKIPDAVSFSIGFGNNRQVVLRFRPYLSDYVDIKELSIRGSEAYKNGDYDACIDAYRQLLEFGEPKVYVYARLGLAYMKNSNIDLAIDYLTVATELSKNVDSYFDFSELIASLKGLIPCEEKKPFVKMSTSEFENDLYNYYGIEQVEQVAELVSTGMTLDDACLSVELDEEQKSIISLIFAKNCYAQENWIMGDQYLKKVEKTKNKSKFVKSLFKEVQENRRFYKHRVEKDQKKLILTSKV